MKTVRVTISPTGGIEMEVEGVHGGSCVDLTRNLEEALGMDPGDRELKNEYYEPDGQMEVES